MREILPAKKPFSKFAECILCFYSDFGWMQHLRGYAGYAYLKVRECVFSQQNHHGWKATMIDFDFAVEIKHKKVLEISI